LLLAFQRRCSLRFRLQALRSCVCMRRERSVAPRSVAPRALVRGAFV
jgi:hypothetical protein